jgi:hypothetical protein
MLIVLIIGVVIKNARRTLSSNVGKRRPQKDIVILYASLEILHCTLFSLAPQWSQMTTLLMFFSNSWNVAAILIFERAVHLETTLTLYHIFFCLPCVFCV